MLMTATPRVPSADTDSIRPDQSPRAIGTTAPVATESLNTPPRARAFAPNTIDWPSPDQAYCPIAPLNEVVSWRGSPPFRGDDPQLVLGELPRTVGRCEVGERLAFGRPLEAGRRRAEKQTCGLLRDARS